MRTLGLRLAAVILLSIGSALDAAPPTTAPTNRPLGTELGQWWQFRGDRQLTGRSAAKGQITKPAIVWKHAVSARETILAARLLPGPAGIPLPTADMAAGVAPDRLFADWGAAMPLADLEGDGKLVGVQGWAGANSKLGKILSDVPGLQLITCAALNYPEHEPYLGTVRMQQRKAGQWVERWKTITDTLIWQSEPIFGDFDRDGRPDVALLSWYKLDILDADSGRITHQGVFKKQDESPELGGRAYGWFGAVDLDADGRDEFVIIDDFTHHVDVMGWRNGQLERLWHRNLHKPGEYMPSPADTVAMVPNPEPVQDLYHDGRREVIVSIYNENRDQLWHTVVFDGMTGQVREDLAGWFLCGARDLDGDGSAELLCAQTPKGLRRPEPTTLAISTFKGGKRATRWTENGTAFQMADLPDLPHNINSGAAQPTRTVLCGAAEKAGRPVFFTRRATDLASGHVELTVWQADGGGGQIRRLGTIAGPRLEALAVRPPAAGQPTLLLRARGLEGETTSAISGDGVTCEPVLSRLVPAPMSPVVVGRMQPGAAPTIIVQGPEETVEAIRPQKDGSVERLWRVPGRTMTCNNYYEGALLADLAGDGSLDTVIGTRGDGDCARLEAVDAAGHELWHHDFPEFPGTPPPWNVPGLMYWQAGYFRDPQRMDLLVQLRRIGGETYLLDGRSGKQIWTRDHSTDEREFGRTWLTIFDYNHDGHDDALTNMPDVFCVADGRTGDLLLKKHARDFAPGQGYWGGTVVADFLGHGSRQMLYANPTAMALLRSDGTPVWKTAWDEKDPCHPYHGSDVRPAPGDADGDGGGDGHLDIYVPGVKCGDKRELQCRDAASGAVKWRLPLPDHPSEPAVADIDGDGRDECLFTIATTLYCVGATPDGRAGQVKWMLPLPNYATAPAVADVLGDGVAQVVVGCGDGYVYGIGPAK